MALGGICVGVVNRRTLGCSFVAAREGEGSSASGDTLVGTAVQLASQNMEMISDEAIVEERIIWT